MKEIKSRGDVNIVLDISSEKIVPFLKAAADVKMLTEYVSYFITNLDTHTLNLGEIENMESNITCLRLVDPNSEELVNALRAWRQKEFDFNLEEKEVPLEAGLVHDAVQIYYNTLEHYTNQKIIRTKHNCSDIKSSGQKPRYGLVPGFEIAKFMKTQEFEGTTGMVEFNQVEPFKGCRTQFKMEILEHSKIRGDFSKIGYWDTTNKVKYDRELEDPDVSLSNVQFFVINN